MRNSKIRDILTDSSYGSKPNYKGYLLYKSKLYRLHSWDIIEAGLVMEIKLKKPNSWLNDRGFSLKSIYDEEIEKVVIPNKNSIILLYEHEL